MNAAQKIHTCEDARQIARRKLPWMVFDYIDGSAGTEYAEKLNRQTLQSLPLSSRILNNVEHRSVAVDVFDHKAELPFGISPMGMCNLVGPGSDDMLARFAAKYKTPVGVSTAASTPLERMIETAEGHAWFQLYFSGNEQSSNTLIDRAEQAGYKTLVLTVDVPEVGRRPRELRRGFTMPFKIGVKQFIDFAVHPTWSIDTLINGKPELANFGGNFGEFDRTSSRAGADWAFLDRIRDRWKGQLVVKGVTHPDDAEQLQRRGVDAIQVSSHGGRQLDSSYPAILALQAIRQRLGKEFPVFYDSGLRCGEDIVKAYAMGASFVLLGRPLLFAMAAAKQAGLFKLGTLLETETSICLAQLGLTSIQSVDENVLMAPDANRKATINVR